MPVLVCCASGGADERASVFYEELLPAGTIKERPILNIAKPNKAQPAITPVIGKLVPLLNTPTNAAANAPIPI